MAWESWLLFLHRGLGETARWAAEAIAVFRTFPERAADRKNVSLHPKPLGAIERDEDEFRPREPTE